MATPDVVLDDDGTVSIIGTLRCTGRLEVTGGDANDILVILGKDGNLINPQLMLTKLVFTTIGGQHTSSFHLDKNGTISISGSLEVGRLFFRGPNEPVELDAESLAGLLQGFFQVPLVATKGLAVQSSATAPALEVNGSVQFSTVGDGKVARGVATAQVTDPRVTATSHITVTLVNDPGGPVAVKAVNRQPGKGFILLLTAPPLNETRFTYCIMEPGS